MEIIDGGLGLLTSADLATGIGIGLAAALVGWLIADRPQGIPGLSLGCGLAAAGVAAWIYLDRDLGVGLPIALVLTGTIAAVGLTTKWRWWCEAAAVAGALAVQLEAAGSARYRLGLLVATGGAVWLVTRAETSLRRGIPTTILFAAATLALVVGVPETSRALLVAGSAVPFAVLPLANRRLGALGAATYPILFVWVTLIDRASARGSVFGPLAALGVLALGSLAARLASKWSPGWLIAGQFAWALYASRIAGVRRGTVGSLVLLGAGAILVWWFTRRRQELQTIDQTRPGLEH